MPSELRRASRAELESAFQHYQDEVAGIAASGEWSGFADLFSEDATYVEHAYGTFTGREEIRDWIVRTMTTFPGSEMPGFPIEWYVVDEERGRIVCEVWNDLRDPGDGERHGASNLTILTYAGDGLWSCEEDGTTRRRSCAPPGAGRRWPPRTASSVPTAPPGWSCSRASCSAHGRC